MVIMETIERRKGEVNWEPLIVAGSALLVLLTPAIGTYVTLQLRLMELRVGALERGAVEDRLEVKVAIAAVGKSVVTTAADTQAVVKDIGGKS